MIELKNIIKTYSLGKTTINAIDNVNLRINEGEFLAIVGPSGSGKSTLLHMIGGLDQPTQGQVIVDGLELNIQKDDQLAEYRNNKVGFVFQVFNLQSTLTALENVMLPLVFAGISKKERVKKATGALKKVGLEKRMDHRPTELSGGESQRVAIARALVNSPRMILADEPTGNLDSKSGSEVVSLFKKLNKEEKITVILVTHNQKDASSAQRKIEMLDGKIKEKKE